MLGREKKPTLAEYEEIGGTMKVIYRDLVRLRVLVSCHSGKTKSKTQEIVESTRKLDALRSAFVDEMFEQYPVELRSAKGREMLSYFYGRV